MMQLRNILLLICVLAVVRGDDNIPTRDDFDDLSILIEHQKSFLHTQKTEIGNICNQAAMIRIEHRLRRHSIPHKCTELLTTVDKQRDLFDREADFVDHLRDNIFRIREESAVVRGDDNIPTRDDFDELWTMIQHQKELLNTQEANIRSIEQRNLMREELYGSINEFTQDHYWIIIYILPILFRSVNQQRDLLKLQADFVDHLRDNIFRLREENEVEPSSPDLARDCKELLDRGFTEDNVYTIHAGSEAIQVYCNMSMGGWIVFQRRFNGSVNFTRNFDQYSEGFGNLQTEFWLGLNKMHQITRTGNWEMRVDFESYSELPRKSYAEYNNFRIGSSPLFTFNLNTSSYSGTAGNGFWNTNGRAFSTYDQDQDPSGYFVYCPKRGGSGGWWYLGCGVESFDYTFANGMPYNKRGAIKWWTGAGQQYFKTSEFKIRLIDSKTDSWIF